MANYIKLNLNGLLLSIERFSSKDKPRRSGDFSIDRSAYLTPVVTGLAYEDPQEWGFTALLNEPERAKLETIYSEQRRLFRTLQSSYPIILTDCTSKFEEIAPRTRAIAPSPDNLESITYSGFISYYAQFYVLFAAPPTFVKNGRFWDAEISFTETESKVAP